MKKIFWLLTLSFFISSISFAQHQTNGISFMTYAGGGFFLPSSQMKLNSKIGNGVNFSFGHFQSIGKQKHGWQWGIEARLNYSKFEKDLWAPASLTRMNYDDGSAIVPMPLQIETEKKKPDAFHFLIGPSPLISYKKFLFQPSLMLGYASVSQEKFHFYSVVPIPSSSPAIDTTFNFYSGGHETNNGFVVVPGIKAGYRIHKNLAAFISLEYSIGSKQKFTDSAYFPLQMPPSDVYEYDELTNGTHHIFNRESTLRAFLINFQIAFTLPRKSS